MYILRNNGLLYNWRYLIGDIFSMEISLLISYFFRILIIDVSNEKYYKYFGVGIFFIIILVAFFSNSYKNISKRGYFIEFVETLRFSQHVLMIVLGVFFFTQISMEFSRLIIAWWFLISILICYFTRIFIKNKIMPRISTKSKLFIILNNSITNDEYKNLIEKFNNYKIVCIGLLEKEINRLELNNNTVYGKEKIISYALREEVDEIAILETNYIESINEIIEECTSMGIVVHCSIDSIFLKTTNMQVNTISDQIFITSFINKANDRDLFLKRLLDIVGSIVGMIILAILFIPISLVIHISSPGKVIFTQTRVGQNGKLFDFYKFRSMYMDAEVRKAELMAQNEMKGKMFKMEDDPRITPVGKFLRKTSLDELPQFWNVLKGDMSLVGTRPPTVDEYLNYESSEKSRLAMKPGITGMWQVSGRSDIKDFEEVVTLDRKYIDNWKLGLDIKILALTVLKIIKREGAK